MEMNLSETAFLWPAERGYRLRWFTPTTEVELCGHATLAAAHILFTTGKLMPHQVAEFYTLSGLLTVTQKDGLLEMNFPATPAAPCREPDNLRKALGNITPLSILKNQLDLLVEVESAAIVKSLRPDFNLLKRVDARGIIVTSRSSDPQYDFVSRFFAPAVGINEDPVTGSAHCTLGPYWEGKLNKSQLTARQVSRRGGTVQIEVKGERILLRGYAVTVFSINIDENILIL